MPAEDRNNKRIENCPREIKMMSFIKSFFLVIILFLVFVFSYTGCKNEEYIFFEVPVDGFEAPDTIKVNESLKIKLFGTFTSQQHIDSEVWPQIDNIDYLITKNRIDLKAIAKKPAGADTSLWFPYLRSWEDSVEIKNLKVGLYEIRARSREKFLIDTVIVKNN